MSARTTESGPRVRKSMVDESKDSRLSKTSGAVSRLTSSRLLRNPANRVIGRFLTLVGRFLRWLAPKYFINAWHEVRQATWPSRRESLRLTSAVFIFAIIFGTLVALVDKGIDEIFKKVILK